MSLAAEGGLLKRMRASSSAESSPENQAGLTQKKVRRDKHPVLKDMVERPDSASESDDGEAPDSLRNGSCSGEKDCADAVSVDDGPWTRVFTRGKKSQMRAVKRAERDVARRNPGYKSGIVGFEVEFAAADGEERFRKGDLYKIFRDVQGVVAAAQPRLNARGGITVRVPAQSDVELLKTVKEIGDIDVELVPSQGTPWGRISGVHPFFSEEDLLEALRPQGVEEVRREMFTVNECGARVRKPSNRVRLRFNAEPCSEVSVLRQVYRVTLCMASPLQCLSCCGFGHKAVHCPKKSSPRCRKCGIEGHQIWQCSGRARCLNCKGPHASSSPKCPVYAVHAKAARDRFIGRVMAGLENTAVREMEPAPPCPTPHASGARLSFADVVGKAPTKTLVRTTAAGDRVLIHLPKSPMKVGPRQDDKRVKLKTGSRWPRMAEPPVIDPEALTASIKEQVVKEVKAELNGLVVGLFATFKSEMQAMMLEIVSAVKSTATRDAAAGAPVSVALRAPNASESLGLITEDNDRAEASLAGAAVTVREPAQERKAGGKQPSDEVLSGTARK